MGIDLARGDRLYKLHRFREAVEAASRELVHEPDSPWAYGLRGAAWLALGEKEQAAEDIRTAAGLAPEEGYFHYLLSFIFAHEHNLNRALDSIDFAICIQPLAQYFSRRADLLLQAKEFREALAAAEDALRLDPAWEPALLARSIALFKLENYAEAEETLYATLGVNPENPGAHSLLGSIGLLNKAPETIASHLREARRISPLLHNRSNALKVAYGRSLWPFSAVERWRRRYLGLTPKARWLFDVGVSTVLILFIALTRSTPDAPSAVTIGAFVLLGNVVVFAHSLDLHTPLAATFFNYREFDARRRTLIWPAIKHLYCWACLHLVASGAAMLLAVLSKSAALTLCVIINWPMAAALAKQRPRLKGIGHIVLPLTVASIAVWDFYWNTPPIMLLTLWAGIVAVSGIANQRIYWKRS